MYSDPRAALEPPVEHPDLPPNSDEDAPPAPWLTMLNDLLRQLMGSGPLALAQRFLVDPEVGEFVTSLDMAGCSLTLCFLDDELDRYWRAPVDTPVLRKGPVQAPKRVMFGDAIPLSALGKPDKKQVRVLASQTA